jgi:hypothetical protein
MKRLKFQDGVRGEINDRNQMHIQAMKELKWSYNNSHSRLHSPRTLDESNYDFLGRDDLERRDRSQILTLYLEGQKAIAEAESSAPPLASAYIRHGSMLFRPAVPNYDLIQPKMLMVPQLWLWKLDERQLRQIGVTSRQPLSSKTS